MRCPNCGTENPDAGSKFCQRCGAPLTPEAQMQQMGAPPAKKKMSTTTMVVLIVVAIVVIVIVAGIWIVVSSFNNVTHGDVEMDVTTVTYSQNLSGTVPYSVGDRFALVTVHITNNGNLPIATSYAFFQLTAGGSEYTADMRFASEMSNTVMVGSSLTLTLTFEIPSSATPTHLDFNGIFGSASCDVP